MNKQQIILPLAAILIVALVGGIIHGRNQARGYVRARSEEIGRSLIRETNSAFVVEIGPSLRSKLSEFLSSPAKVEDVLFGDEESPIGDGSASSRLHLVNDRHEHLVIRLREDSKQNKFHILGFWTPQDSTNGSRL